MRRRVFLTGMVACGLCMLPGGARGCFFHFDPVDVKVDPEGKGSIMVQLEWEHRRCVLDEQDVNVDGEGGVKIVKKPFWEKIKRGVYEGRIDFVLEGDGGRIRVWRDCSQKGLSEGIIKIRRGA